MEAVHSAGDDDPSLIFQLKTAFSRLTEVVLQLDFLPPNLFQCRPVELRQLLPQARDLNRIRHENLQVDVDLFARWRPGTRWVPCPVAGDPQNRLDRVHINVEIFFEPTIQSIDLSLQSINRFAWLFLAAGSVAIGWYVLILTHPALAHFLIICFVSHGASDFRLERPGWPRQQRAR